MPALAVVSIALTAYSMVQQNAASKAAEQLARDTAQRNANIDITQAKQLGMDTAENIRQMRDQAAIYTSRQQASYAASGVLADSGSPLAVQASTVGKMEQRIQQEHVNSVQKQEQLYSSAKAGIAYGDATASALNKANNAAMIRSGANLLTTAYGAYQGGAFSSGGGSASVSPAGTYTNSQASFAPGSGQALLSGGGFKY